MHAHDVKQTKKPERVRSEPSHSTVDRTPPRRSANERYRDDGRSLSRTLDDDVKESLDAVGKVCRTVTIGLLAIGVAGVGTLMALVAF